MMANAGDTIRIDGVEFIVRFDGRQALIDDIKWPSSLSAINVDTAEVVKQRLKGQQQRTPIGYAARTETYQKAKADIAAKRWEW